jgi:hypothetical protein
MLALPMRKTLLLTLLALTPLVASPQSPIPPRAEEMAQDLRTVASFYPRLEGSAGERKAIAFITERLTARRIAFRSFDFGESDFQHSFSTCLRVDIPGTRKDTLVVAVPLDNPPGAGPGEDGSPGIILALALLEGLRDSTPPLSVTVLFLGAEFGATADYPMGSTLFLRDFRPEYRTAVLYLNLRAVPQRLVVRGGGTGIVSPYWLMERTLGALGRARLPSVLRAGEYQVFRMGLAGERTIIEPYLQAGYPSVSLEGEYPAGGPADPEAWLFSAYLFFTEFLHASTEGIPESWDRHYLLFPVGDGSLIVPEMTYVIILVAGLAGALLYSLAFRRGLRKYLRTLLRNSLSIAPIYALPFLFLLAGTLAVEAVLRLRAFPALWSYTPLAFLALKLAVPLLLFAASYPLIRRLPFSRNGSFYSAASLFFLIADILVVAAFNVSFTPSFVWALAFVLLATLVPNRWAKLALFLPSAFLGVNALLEIFLMPALPFCRVILLSRVRGNLLEAGFVLPFILFAVRLGLLFRGRGVLKRRGRTVLAVVLFAAGAAVSAGWLMRFTPFGPGRPQPLVVTQSIDGDSGENGITFDSPAPVGDLTVTEGGRAIVLRRAGTAGSLALAAAEVPIRLTASSEEVLNKRNVVLSISTGTSPRVMEARLTSAEDFILLDSSFPAIRESGREYRLLIGAFPPDPLPVQLTLPVGMSFTFTLTVESDAPLIGVEVGAGSARLQTRVRMVKSILLRT